MDKNGDGTLTKKEIEEALKLKGEEFLMISELIKNADGDRNGVLNYTEFISSCIANTKSVDNKRLKQVFDAFDMDKNNQISFNEISQIFGIDLKKG
jgi:Ca2+-binding EF-hand superfamily protein